MLDAGSRGLWRGVERAYKPCFHLFLTKRSEVYYFGQDRHLYDYDREIGPIDNYGILPSD